MKSFCEVSIGLSLETELTSPELEESFCLFTSLAKYYSNVPRRVTSFECLEEKCPFANLKIGVLMPKYTS